jgi:hypothetical protein
MDVALKDEITAPKSETKFRSVPSRISMHIDPAAVMVVLTSGARLWLLLLPTQASADAA